MKPHWPPVKGLESIACNIVRWLCLANKERLLAEIAQECFTSRGYIPDPTVGAYATSPDLLAGISGEEEGDINH